MPLRTWPIFAIAVFISGCGRSSGNSSPAPAPRSDLRLFWSLHDRAKDLYAAGSYAEAGEAYRKALEKNPRHAASLYNLAHVEFILHRHREAAALLERFREVDPGATKANLLKAMVLAEAYPGAPFDLAAAAEAAKSALAMNLEDSGPALVQGRIALMAGDLERARERLEISARANPKNAEALSLLGILELRGGRTREAREFFQRAEKAAEGAPPPAGVSGEGDTAKARAGERRDRLLQARWLLRFMGEGGAAPSSFPPPLPAALFSKPEAAGAARSTLAVAAARFSGGPNLEVAVGSLDRALEFYRFEGGSLKLVAEAAAAGLSALIPVDLNGDGKLDLYALGGGGYRGGTPRALLNQGGLRFEAQPATGGPRRAFAAAAVDVDGDGAAEIVEVGPPAVQPGEPGPVRLLRRGSSGGLELEEVAVPGAEAGLAVAVAVLRPGKAAPAGSRPGAEIAVAFMSRSPLVLSFEEGRLRPRGECGLEAFGAARALAALDADEDGQLDLALAAPVKADQAQQFFLDGAAEAPALKIFLGRPGGRFEEAVGLLPPFTAGITSLSAGDVNGDGAMDLLACAGGPEPYRLEPWWVFLRQGKSFAASRGPALKAPDLKAAAALVADLDGDGTGDLLMAAGGLLPGDPGRLQVFYGVKKPASAGAAPKRAD